jgi:signal transduction histidine kinase
VREVPARGDGDYLKEAAINVVHFVLRQSGTRHVSIKVSSSAGGSRLAVVGDGEKIDPEDREKIFEPYARPSKQAPVGHGLGLALAKMVVELHGGTIWVEDAPRGGSAFVMELQSENGSPRLRTVE